MAFLENNKKERFSLLLLEPSEIYFEDFAVYYYPPGLKEEDAIKKKQKGRLKLCSKSLVFDPSDINVPILKFPLKDCKQIEHWKGSLMSKLDSKGNVITVDCEQIVEMLEGNIIAPYISKMRKETHMFSLIYANIIDCLPQMKQLLRASTLLPAEQATMVAVIVHSRQLRILFNQCWLEGLHEKIVLETQGTRVTPLVTNPGRIMLTSIRLYFQPYNKEEPLKLKLGWIKRAVKRRFLLSQVGLELFCSESSSISQLFLSLNTSEDRDNLYEQLLRQPVVKLDKAEPENMTLLWQNGIISNYDYLLYLNSVADRSFNDLTQYPVFPWVVADYSSETLDLTNPSSYRDLSKPIGALNLERLQRLKARYKDMAEPKFLYGSHYSAPGFVLYYLVRKVPQYMLCLQNGRFDHPDRMFNSVADTWRNITTNTTDFKELIPEFYQPENKGDFLINSLNLDFGVRQSNAKVDDVELPPWAKDPEDFIDKMRLALESDIVSNTLHHWIDLIFGYKQQGVEAELADNVFYYLTYEGAVELDHILDMNERYSLEVQITEFGQVPRQIFKYPHPQRNVNLQIEDGNANDEQCEEKEMELWTDLDALDIDTVYQLHKEAVNDVKFSEDGSNLFSVAQDSLLKIYSVEEKKQQRSISISTMALSCLALMPDGKTVIVGSWDNNIYIYNIEYGNTIFSTLAHDTAISDLCWNNDLVITSSWDSTVKVWKYVTNSRSRNSAAVKLLDNFEYETEVCCVALNSTSTLLLIGTEDGQINMWDLNTRNLISQQQVFSTAVRKVAFSPDDHRFICCGQGLTIFDVDTSTGIFHEDTGEELRCMKWDGATVLAGGENGNLLVWDLVNGQLKKSIRGHEGPVRCIDVHKGKLVATGGSDKKIVIWKKM